MRYHETITKTTRCPLQIQVSSDSAREKLSESSDAAPMMPAITLITKTRATRPRCTQAMILAAVSRPSPVSRPPEVSILRFDEGTRNKATMAGITGQITKEMQASTSATMAVLSVVGLGPGGP